MKAKPFLGDLIWAVFVLLISQLALLGAPVILTNSPMGYVQLYSFPYGQVPTGGALILGSDNFLYGAVGEPRASAGTQFLLKMDTSGNLIWSFALTNAGPYSDVVQGKDGSICALGGTGITSASTNGVMNWFLPATNNGAVNWLTLGADGNYYGVCSAGGTNKAGQIVAISPGGEYLWTFSFGGTNYGSQPNEAVLVGSDGNLYGTTGGSFAISTNGDYAYGCVYSITTLGEWRWNVFCPQGYQQPRTLLNAPNGSLYVGTGLGLVDISTNGTVEWNVTVQGTTTLLKLIQGTNGVLFMGGYAGPSESTNGIFLQTISMPVALQRKDGNLYGLNGGFGDGPAALFCLTTNGARITTQNTNQSGAIGAVVSLVQDEAGNLFGMTAGAQIFELVAGPELLTWPRDVFPQAHGILFLTNNIVTYVGAPPLSMQWELNGIALTNGNTTNGQIIGAQTGHLVFNPSFSMTNGFFDFVLSNGFGVVTSPPAFFSRTNRFPTVVSGGVFSEPSTTNFPFKAADGVPVENPSFIAKGASNSLYVSTSFANYVAPLVGALESNGVARWGVDMGGEYSRAGLLQGVDGNIYVDEGGNALGVVSASGQAMYKVGTEFEWGDIVQGPNSTLYWTGPDEIYAGAPGGSVYWTYQSYTNFGFGLPTGIAVGPDGSLYVSVDHGESNNCGAVLSLTTNGVYRWEILFDPTSDLYAASLIMGTDGNLYGTTFATNSPYVDMSGLSGNLGELFCMTTNGELRWVYQFNGSNGYSPTPQLLEGKDGYLYGTTYEGGTANLGTVFRIAPSGTDFETIFYFSGGADGANPMCGLVQLDDGSFYGVASEGGINGVGTLYRLDLPPAQGAPRVSSATVSNGGVNTTWTTLANRTYQLQASDDLQAWSNLGKPVVAADVFTTFSDPGGLQAHRFYRLVRE